MADDGKGGQGGQDGGQGDGQGDDKGGLEATVRRVLADVLPKGGGGRAADAHDVTAQVEAAVAKVHRGQEAARVMDDIQARLKAVEDKKIPERKPREFRPIHRLMGWVTDDDQ